ncbi:MAG: hypothetical protein RL217_381 [Pseudomonadota bacterium]|jgi:murein DD-endopeptidase MepM/ murein hydrolase activator NlpD
MDLGRLQSFPRAHGLALLAACLLLAVITFWPSSKPNQDEVNFAIDISQTTSTPEPLAPAEPSVKWESTKVKAGDTLSTIFSQQQLSATDLAAVLAVAPKESFKLQVGQTLRWVRSANNQLQQFEMVLSPLAHHAFVRDADGKMQYELAERTADYRPLYASATIENSLFVDGMKAGIPDQVLYELANIFGWDIDFAQDIRQGDRFSLLYEEVYVDGERIGTGKILTARFYNQGRELTAVRYTDPKGRADYYSPSGQNMRKAFLRNPIDFTRISSRFSLSRKHPVLHTIVRAHKGTDYAAPTGTPIKAAGDGKIIFAGRKGGYGNAVVLQHGSRYQSLYAHLSSFNRNTKVGRNVKQGQVIGYVGSTGLATGPHLHYEFHVDGVQRDPLRVDFPKAETIPASLQDDFKQHTQSLLTWLDSFNASVASGPSEAY